MKANLSILGLYQYNPTLFDEMQLPDQLDREVLANAIIMECAELELVYPSLTFMRYMLRSWSKQMLPVWQRIYDAVTTKYNPLENYDRIEEWTDSDEMHGTSTAADNLTSTGKVSAFNDTEFSNRNQDITEDNSSSQNDSESSAQHSGRTHGNIGVTTSQQMLQSELDIAGKTDIYSIIAADFKMKFCIMVY